MDKTLYDLMDWAAVEEIVYSESEAPHAILGPHMTEAGLLIQTFQPGSESVRAVFKNGRTFDMDCADDAGFYACLVPVGPEEPVPGPDAYVFRVTGADGIVRDLGDPYAYPSTLTEEELAPFGRGTELRAWEKLGAREMIFKGGSGVRFSVWAPGAMRVSVVGDFNAWDGRAHQMRKLGESGVFEIFIPGLEAGGLYKYEIKDRLRETFLKADPYARQSEQLPGTASVIPGPDAYDWQDENWLSQRSAAPGRPVSVYEVHLGGFSGGGKNYREIGVELAKRAKGLHFTHVEIMPVMEYPRDESLGYVTGCYYAPTSRYGSPDDLKTMIDTLHKVGIGVILDWVPSGFAPDDWGLSGFDGMPLYGEGGGETRVFRYDRPQVESFLSSNAYYWIREFHADGLRVANLASVLYHQIGGRHNLYGGNENLEGADWIRELNRRLKEEFPNVLLIADASAEWAGITAPVSEDGLGFDVKWNGSWTESCLGYLREDPLFRSAHYGELTYPMLYQYSERFILPLSHDFVAGSRPTLSGLLPACDEKTHYAELRSAFAYAFTHPGRKLVFMGQEFASTIRWDGGAPLSFEEEEEPDKLLFRSFIGALNEFYIGHPALRRMDDEPEGFEWVNCHSWKENVIAFERRSVSPEETLLVLVNFSQDAFPKFNVGVPFYGRYKEIFSTESQEFGGSGIANPRALRAKKMDVDERKWGITAALPAMSVIIFRCEEIPEPGIPERLAADAAAEDRAKGKTALVVSAPEKGAEEQAGTVQKAAKKAKDSVVRQAGAAKKAVTDRAGAAKKVVTDKAGAAKKAVTKKAGAAKKAVTKQAGAAAELVTEKAGQAADIVIKAVADRTAGKER